MNDECKLTGLSECLRRLPSRRRGGWLSQGGPLCLLLLPLAAQAQLEVKTNDSPETVFGGAPRRLNVTLRNPTDTTVTAGMRAQLYQASAFTAMPAGEPHDWKTLQILPGQTVLETADLDFPVVRGETRFVVRWLAAGREVPGATQILVYPADLLKELKTLAGDKPLGVLDPQNVIKPLLKAAAVDFIDLEESTLEDFRGRLAILGPFQSSSQMHEGLARRIQVMARRGAAVVWMQPPAEGRRKLAPSFYPVLEGPGAVVVVQADLISNLAENPQAQLNLIQLAELALRPEPARLPHPAL